MNSQYTRYVLMVVMDPDTGHAIGMTKLKGPAQLIGKITFPGGKLEEGESVFEAASRELREETGVEVDETAWVPAHTIVAPHYEMHIVAAHSPDVLQAQTREEEPVSILAVERHKEYARTHAQTYTPDFLQVLAVAEQALASKTLAA